MLKNFVLIATLFLSSIYAGPSAFFDGNKAYEKGDYAKAVQFYQAGIKAKDQEVFCWFNMGNALVQLQKNHLALVAYKRSVELAPQFAKPWSMIGDLYFLNENDGEAISAYQRAMELGEDSPRIWSALGEIALRNKDWTDAEKWFEKVVREDVLNTNAWLALAQIQESIKDDEAAKKILLDCLDKNPLASGNVHFYLARLYLRLEDNKNAIKALEDGLFFEPKQINYRRTLARLYLDEKQPWMAIFALEEGLNKDPKNKKILLDLAQIYFDLARLEDSQKYFVEAQKNGAYEAKVGLQNIANSYFNSGDKEKSSQVISLIAAHKIQ